MDDFRYDPYLKLYLPLWKLDGASFMSQDAYGHLCTVTGALWRLDGRIFNGVNDVITVPHHAALNFGWADSFSFWFWIKTNQASGDYKNVLGKGTGSPSYNALIHNGYPSMYLGNWATAARCWSQASTLVNDNVWHFVLMTYDGTKVVAGQLYYVDGTASATSAIVDTLDADIANTQSLTIGSGSGFDALAATIPEIGINSRGLTALEGQNIYLATKWRYK